MMTNRIEINPSVHFGKPCVAGTRIPVLDVLELVAEGISFEQITRKYYPDLQVEDVRACMHYAMDVIAAEVPNISPKLEATILRCMAARPNFTRRDAFNYIVGHGIDQAEMCGFQDAREQAGEERKAG
jgi:uncharacterized protein (DUF433 family)